MSEKTSFFAELKRRNVYKVAVAYGVVSWLLIQVATQVFPFFEIPNWAVRLVVLVLIIGFPIALVLSWAFEITPEGIKRESDVAPEQSITHHTGRKLVGLTIALAVIAAGLLGWQMLGHSGRSRAATVGEAASFPPKQDGKLTASPTTDGLAGARPSVVPEKSIAVLPFENLSEDKGNAFFASGIQDEILTRLAKIAALKVISRTSTQQYQSKPGNLTDIAKQLGVANILEGSVQKAGDNVHINVQLIKAATDAHLWAESYDRELKNIFGVEGEVAGAIAQALKATLTGSEEKAISGMPTQNIEAYNAYLRGLSIEHGQYTYQAYQNAADAYGEAVRLDPKFALAWARMGVLRSFLFFNTFGQNNTPASVKEAADRAMALAPEAAESWVAQGAYRYRVLRDFNGAVTAYQESLKRFPNNSYALQNLGHVQRRLGHWQDAEANFKKAIEIDPLDVSLLISTASEFYGYLRRFDDAFASVDRALQIAPNSETAIGAKASLYQNQGRLADAARELSRIPTNSTDDFILGAQVAQAEFERDFEKGIALIEHKLKSLAPGETVDSFTEGMLVQLGFLQKWTGRDADAAQSFQRAIKLIKPTTDSVVAAEANGVPAILAAAYAGLGEKNKALAQAEQAVKDYETDAINRTQALVNLAQIQAMLGEQDAAIAGLPKLLELPAGVTVANLKLDPFWDPLRKDPRFQKLVADADAATPGK